MDGKFEIRQKIADLKSFVDVIDILYDIAAEKSLLYLIKEPWPAETFPFRILCCYF